MALTRPQFEFGVRTETWVSGALMTGLDLGSGLGHVIALSGLAFLGSTLLVIVWQIFDGSLSLDGLLTVKSGKWVGQSSPARMTALLSTLGVVVSVLPR